MSERPSGSSPENEVEDVELTESVNVEPIRTVVRELTRPDGSTVRVEVPVYPPFEMKDLANRVAGKSASNGKRARAK